ncbi:MAG TPA: DUF952 domain-containing protein [Stellaceae bacterium]|nr:DUF952 domain-containing protein [Stellaceae bacterium]
MPNVYKICPAPLWQEAEAAGMFRGAELDARDGFIHLSSAEQVKETAALHFKGQADLVLIAIHGGSLGRLLRWEKARGGALFPHLHAPLSLAAVIWVKPLPLGPDGAHIFPPQL